MRRAAWLLLGPLLIVLAGTASPAEARQSLPTVSVFPATANEVSDLSSPGLPCAPPGLGTGYTGPCNLVFPVSVEPFPPGDEPVTVTVSFSYGTASAADVAALPAPITLSFPAGPLPCVCVVVADDATSEPDETIVATITNVTGAVIANGSASGTILDDEAPAPAPDIEVVEEGTSFATLAWDPVTPVRGSVTGYAVIARDSANGEFRAWERVTPDVRSASVPGLGAGRVYDVFVVAETTDGYGDFGSLTAARDPAGPAPALAGAPTVVGATAGDTFVTVGWTPPTADNGSPVRAYSVVATRASSGALVAWRNVAADVRSASLPQLTNGLGLRVVVLAWNGVGPVASAARNVTPLAAGPDPAGAPAVPFIWADSRLGRATVVWGPPDELGRPVLGYSVILTEHIHDRPVHLVEWRNVGPDIRTSTFSGLRFCHYDVHVIPITSSGFGAANTTPIVVPPPVVEGRIDCLNPPD